jgi:hypothetical protein
MNLLVLNGDAIEQNNRMRGYFDKRSPLKNDSKPNHRRNGDQPNTEKPKDKLAKTGNNTSEKPKFGNWVSPELKRKRKKDGQCEKCGKSGHSFSDCNIGWRANASDSDKPNKKAKKDKPDNELRITELGSDNEAGKV